MRDSIPYLTPQEHLGKVEPSLLDRERSIAPQGYSRWLDFPAFSSSLGMFLLRNVGAARGGAMVAWRILDQPRPDSYVNL